MEHFALLTEKVVAAGDTADFLFDSILYILLYVQTLVLILYCGVLLLIDSFLIDCQ